MCVVWVKCSLHFLFGKNLERATKIVDQRGVKKISGQPSGRSIFQVQFYFAMHCTLDFKFLHMVVRVWI